MIVGKNVNSRYVVITIAWLCTWICCTLAIVYFYGLSGNGVVDPFRSHFEEVVAALQTALVATLASSWAIWFGAKQKRSLVMAMLRTGFATQVSLTFYGIADWRSPSSLNFIFPSTFFAEYNWLTFIFEVAPVTSTAAILPFLFINTAKRRARGLAS